MSDHLAHAEEHRDLVAGLEYEELEGTLADGLDDEDAYDRDDPKHPDHYETLVDIWDAREGK